LVVIGFRIRSRFVSLGKTGRATAWAAAHGDTLWTTLRAVSWRKNNPWHAQPCRNVISPPHRQSHEDRHPLSPRPLPPTNNFSDRCTYSQSYIQIWADGSPVRTQTQIVRNASSDFSYPDPVLTTATEEVDFLFARWIRADGSERWSNPHITIHPPQTHTHHQSSRGHKPGSALSFGPPPTPLSWSGVLRADPDRDLVQLVPPLTTFTFANKSLGTYRFLSIPPWRARPADCRN